jgi:hypothetical protein
VTLRFDWHPFIDHPIINSKAALVVDLVVKKGSQRATKEKTEQTCKQILSALYSAYFSFPQGSSRVSISLTSNHYTQSDYSFRIVKAVFDCLRKLKWIETEIGTEASKKVTRMWAVGELAMAFDGIGLVWCYQEPKPKASLVVLRNYQSPEGKTKKQRGPKVDVEVPSTPEVQDYRDKLYSFNQFLLKHCIALDLDDQNLTALAEEIVQRAKDEARVWSSEEDEKVGCLDFSRVQLRRIFSRGSLALGGRFYGGWWQTIPSRHRPLIRINGYKTYELDYSSMALRIIYALEGIDVPKEEDLYDIGLPNWIPDDDPRRTPIKTYINALLNDEFGNYGLPKRDQERVGVDQKELYDRVVQRHKPIAHLFNTGIGLKAQFLDSQVAEEVMHAMKYQDVLVLPIHDSFIVRLGCADWLHEAMEDAFMKIVGANVGITLEGTKSNEHFDKTMDEVNQAGPKVVSFKSDEARNALERQRTSIMGKYRSSWREKGFVI